MARVPRFLDVSVPLAVGVPTYPGNPAFQFEPVKRLANGDSANVSRMVMGTHAGTHVDAPLHFFDDGAPTEALALDLLIGRARVVEAHRALLSQGVVIIEGLNLSNVGPGMYELYCLPLRVAGADGAPARVVLKR